MNVLVMGWFSFERYGATAGDLVARDLACSWIDSAGVSYDVALAPPFEGGVNWKEVNPADYTDLLFVCGPFGDDWLTQQFLQRFAHCRKLGLNLTMLQKLDTYNPFDFLIERDSSRAARPDVTFLAENRRVPVVGLMLVHPQEEYGERGRHTRAHAVIKDLIEANDMTIVPIDTRLDENKCGLRSAAEIESLIARMDAVLTTRLHGVVLSLKNGVPPIAVDPISGGAKVARQCGACGWPFCFDVDSVTTVELQAALDDCLAGKAREIIKRCRQHAGREVENVRYRFIEYLKSNRKQPDKGR